MATYKIEFRPAALKQLDSIAPADRRRILARVERLKDDPRPPGCLMLSGNESLWRVRIGDYRVVYQIVDTALVVTIVRLGHRSGIYRDR